MDGMLFEQLVSSLGSQKMAMAFGGEPTKHGAFNGADVSMKEYRPVFLQCAARRLRSHNSPMGIPKKLKK